MAFLYGGGQTSDDDQGKQNIFDAGAGAQAGGETAGGAVQKTSSGGGSVSRGTSAVTASGGSQPQTASSGGYNPKAAQSAYGSLSARIQLPQRSLSDASSSIQKGQENLQAASDQYAAAGAETAKGYQLDDETLKSAASGNDEAFQKTAGRLSQARGQTEAFQGLGENLPDVSNVKDAQKAYAPEAGPNYTSGESRFDAALLRRNPEYLKMQQQILADSAALTKKNDDLVGSKTKEQDAALSKAYGESTSDIRKRLGGLGETVVSSAKAQEQAEDQRRAALDPKSIATQEYQKLKAKIQSDLKSADPRSQQYRSAKYLDTLAPDELISQFVNIDRDTDWREFINDDNAGYYNRVQGLLGNGQMLTPSALGAGADYSFDEGNAYQSVLAKITGQRAAADQVSQQEMDAIRQQAAARAQDYGARDTAQDARSSAEKEIAAYARQKYGQNSQLSDLAQLHAQDLFENQQLYQGVLDKGLIRDQGAVDWSGALTADEAARLNALTADTGGMGSYSEQYKPEYDIEQLKAYYDQYVAPYMKNYQNQYAPQPAAPQPAGGSSTSKPKQSR